jgi:hypothetical protein
VYDYFCRLRRGGPWVREAGPWGGTEIAGAFTARANREREMGRVLELLGILAMGATLAGCTGINDYAVGDGPGMGSDPMSPTEMNSDGTDDADQDDNGTQ